MIVFLIGMPGSGKSTVGRELARSINFSFIDTDDWISNRACLSIPEIFDEVGEQGFREMEQECLEALLGKESLVVSTGGGMAANKERLELMKELGTCIYLEVSTNELFRRVQSEQHRPLLKDDDLKLKLNRLLAHRESYYQKADLKVNAEREIQEIVSEIRAYLR